VGSSASENCVSIFTICFTINLEYYNMIPRNIEMKLLLKISILMKTSFTQKCEGRFESFTHVAIEEKTKIARLKPKNNGCINIHTLPQNKEVFFIVL
jgi:hypothetical protein